MKFSTASLLLLLSGSASAGWLGHKTELTIHLQEGVHDISEALAPEISMKGSQGENIDYGGSCAMLSPGTPGSVWGSVKSSDGKFNWDARLVASKGKYDFGDGEKNGVYGAVQGSNEEKNTFMWVSGACSTAGTVSPLKVGAKKVVELDDGKVMLSPRYDCATAEANLVLGYEKDNTQAYLTLSKEDQDLFVAHKINDSTSTTSKFGRQGFLSASVTHENEHLGSTTVTCTPDELGVEVTKDEWKAEVSTVGSPLSGAHGLKDLKVRLTKSMTFSL